MTKDFLILESFGNVLCSCRLLKQWSESPNQGCIKWITEVICISNVTQDPSFLCNENENEKIMRTESHAFSNQEQEYMLEL